MEAFEGASQEHLPAVDDPKIAAAVPIAPPREVAVAALPQEMSELADPTTVVAPERVPPEPKTVITVQEKGAEVRMALLDEVKALHGAPAPVSTASTLTTPQ